jgi:hypothetical protein
MKHTLQWNGCGAVGERTISCSDHMMTDYATVPEGMTLEEAVSIYMDTYDYNGEPGTIRLSLCLWESYDRDSDPDVTESIIWEVGMA